MKKHLLNILFWSIISAAFIGPGTIATAAKSGHSFGFSLLPALLISIILTIVLQVMVVELKTTTGKELGSLINELFGKKIAWISKLIFIGIFIGCAAYEAGNILGAVSGLALVSDFPKAAFTISIVLMAGLLLYKGNIKWIARTMGLLVLLMAIAFGICAVSADFNFSSSNSLFSLIKYDDQALVLSMALIGTTVVPYNIFLASGIATSKSSRENNIGIIGAVLIGGAVTFAIMTAGTLISGEFSFQSLANIMAQNIGPTGSWLFAFGLFGAGLSSSVTAPLAAALTAKSFFGSKNSDWAKSGKYFKVTWIAVLLSGLIFGLAEVKPISVIILAQALNGFILPIIAIFLFGAFRKLKTVSGGLSSNVSFTILVWLMVVLLVFLGAKSIVSLVDGKLLADQLAFNSEIILSLVLSLLGGIVLWKL